jgi:23S rRNA U2552 (ribose-2'-O)-methylase RlmE/FtsJ
MFRRTVAHTDLRDSLARMQERQGLRSRAARRLDLVQSGVI